VIVVVGDALLDRDLDGRAERLAPDAPVPVVEGIEAHARAGGAGLAATLAAAHGEPVTLVCALGDDSAGRELRALLERAGVAVHDVGLRGATPEKVRVRAGGRALVRLDRGDRGECRRLDAAAVELLRDADAVLVSDYGRGMAAAPDVRAALERRPAELSTVWDPHPNGPAPIPGVTLATPNAREAAAAALGAAGPPADSRAPAPARAAAPPTDSLAAAPADSRTAPPAGAAGRAGSRAAVSAGAAAPAGSRAAAAAGAAAPSADSLGAAPPGDSLAAAVRAARALAARWQAVNVCVTRGAAGAVLVAGAGPPLAVPAPSVTGGDPCGAGDCFAATATARLVAGALPSEAVRAAVAAASAFVAAGGAASAGAPPRTPPAADAFALAAGVRDAGGTVVATGGCFDLLHAGHVRMLAAARRLGDCLIVCLNSDASVARLKGPDRPLVGQEDRRAVLAALGCVDGVAIFEEDDPRTVLRRLRPHLWAKGGDYAVSDLPEAATLAEWGGQAVIVPYVAGRSTSALIARSRG
jgi:rfaE bifunctional protein nucleotidyltransferase chain/domain